MRIVVVSDIHLMRRNSEEAFESLENFLEELDREPDLMVVLGDLIGGDVSVGSDHDEEIEGLPELKELKEFFDRIDCEKFFLRGNHDDHISEEEWERVFGNRPYGSISVEGQDFIFLDSADSDLSGSRGQLGPEQLEFFEEALDSSDDAVVFTHHPIYYTDFSGTYWWDTYPERAICGDKKEANDLFGPEEVKAVFNGHIHERDHSEYEDVDHFTVPPFISVDKDGFTGAYTVIDVDESVEVAMRELPGEEFWTV